MIVLKFGGTSLENAAAMNTAIRIIDERSDRSPVVVLSAVAGTTNTLLTAARLAREGSLEKALELLNTLLDRHVVILENLLESRNTIQRLILEIRRRFEELRQLCQGISFLGELTDRSLDGIASYGEQLSTMIMTETLNERRIQAEHIDARKFMVTGEEFTAAVPLFEEIRTRLESLVKPHIAAGKTVVTEGFMGATRKGITTTLGRGGSDYSAAIIGAALDAKEIQIWTDVDGILTADPRICPGAHRIRVISFREASELAYFGAKVLHPSTILPAVQKNIPVSVLNSRKPGSSGTLIIANPPASPLPVKSIASKKGITVINIQSTRMLMAYGFLEKIFSVFHRYKTPVDLVTTSEVAVSLTIDATDHLDRIVADLSAAGEVATYSNKAIVCIVGEQMRSTAGIADRVFRALRAINLTMISQGASEINMSLVLDEADVHEAVRRLHDEFFTSQPANEVLDPIPHEASS
ncbi:MAG TPA: lysine-sensitive aspartokinase 3 [Bacteroidota bacterium]